MLRKSHLQEMNTAAGGKRSADGCQGKDDEVLQ